MKVKSEREVAQLCLTLSDPMDCSPPGCIIHRIFQARVLEWGAIAFSTALQNHELIGIATLVPQTNLPKTPSYTEGEILKAKSERAFKTI